MQQIIHQQAADNVYDEAIRCVRSYSAREDIRDMAEKVYRRNADTLLSFGTDPNDPDALRYRELVETDVDEIRATLEDPECDLGEAQRQVLDLQHG